MLGHGRLSVTEVDTSIKELFVLVLILPSFLRCVWVSIKELELEKGLGLCLVFDISGMSHYLYHFLIRGRKAWILLEENEVDDGDGGVCDPK